MGSRKTEVLILWEGKRSPEGFVPQKIKLPYGIAYHNGAGVFLPTPMGLPQTSLSLGIRLTTDERRLIEAAYGVGDLCLLPLD